MLARSVLLAKRASGLQPLGCIWLMALILTNRPDMAAGSISDGRNRRGPTTHHRSLT